MRLPLKSITVTDFRSIKGSITLPLDAPVVLIHGQNGVGKTSLLSAIELGLTGHAPSLALLDREYVSHLIHKGERQARISTTIDALASATVSKEVFVNKTGISGEPALAPELAQFYSERCYLAQATLGRLLEIYEDKDTRKTDSPLTKFVKDLLGLDHLDILIEGLHDAGNIRRLREPIPQYWDVRDAIPILEKEKLRDSDELERIESEIKAINARVNQKLPTLGIATDAVDHRLLTELTVSVEEPELQKLALLRREIVATRDQWRTVQSPVNPIERDNAEGDLAAANIELNLWRESTGKIIEELFVRVRSFFSDLPSPLSTGLARTRTAALQAVKSEWDRCVVVLARDAEDVQRVSKLDQSIERANARSVVLDKQIGAHATESEALAKALAGLLPHIQSDDCPVCGRDFAEQASDSLQAHVSRHIARLTESAGRLQALVRERAESARALAEAQRERSAIVARQLPSASRDALKSRGAWLEEVQRALIDAEADIARGEHLISTSHLAELALAKLRTFDQKATMIRASANRFSEVLGVSPVSDDEGLEAALGRFELSVTGQESKLNLRLLTRRECVAELRERQKLVSQRSKIEDAVASTVAKIQRHENMKAKADERISDARDLAHRAREALTNIVRRVFNDSLNAVWRDLFVRLAPDEPFVPAFALPESQVGPVEAVLETLYRSGGKGGNPRAMLSAGNLNTPALTLFLALHLSVAPTFPCLVIDDPVQSMDEVHIAQFAALLRTLSKEKGRQIIIAVHEKPLFDYLALELSPAFQGDRLITIELGRTANGMTVVNYRPVVWKPDRAIAA